MNFDAVRHYAPVPRMGNPARSPLTHDPCYYWSNYGRPTPPTSIAQENIDHHEEHTFFPNYPSVSRSSSSFNDKSYPGQPPRHIPNALDENATFLSPAETPVQTDFFYHPPAWSPLPVPRDNGGEGDGGYLGDAHSADAELDLTEPRRLNAADHESYAFQMRIYSPEVRPMFFDDVPVRNIRLDLLASMREKELEDMKLFRSEKAMRDSDYKKTMRDLLMRHQAIFDSLRKFFTEQSPRTPSDFSSSWTQYSVEGDVNGTRVEALPDSGADMCFISPKLAFRLGLSPEVGTRKRVSLANKKHVKSPGMVKVPWKFTGEPETHILNCWIFPGCVNDLVLGNHFLKATQTLTNLANRMRRIKSKIVEFPRRLRLRLLGEEKQRLWGSLDGHRTAALPDTGSDVMLISSAYAQQIGLTVDRDRKNLLEVEFADGTTAWTSGVVRNVPWTVGGETIRCDFHVLDDLCVDVILSNNYLFDLNVFSEHGDYFFDADSEEDLLQLCNIRLIGRYGDTLDGLEKEYLGDVTSPGAFGPAMIQRELARRDQIRDEILLLPENQREGATQAEAERQRRWQDLKQAHQRRWGTASNGQGSIQRTVAGRKTWWKKKVSISIPLKSLTKSTRP